MFIILAGVEPDEYIGAGRAWSWCSIAAVNAFGPAAGALFSRGAR